MKDLEIVAGVLEALHAAANLPTDTLEQSDTASIVWREIHQQLKARGLNYASIIRAQSKIHWEMERSRKQEFDAKLAEALQES